jgi:Ca2+-binding RTX toxin-like protein
MPGQLGLREGLLVLYPHRRIVSGTVADWEELDIPNSVRWEVRGTDADERFLFEGILGVWIRAGAGDDEILGTPQPDMIDGGAGDDTVTAYGGRDVCERAEHTRGCELRR